MRRSAVPALLGLLAVALIVVLALLGSASYDQAGIILADLLDTRLAPALQLQAVRSLEQLGDPRGGELLVKPENWTRYTPQIRAAVAWLA